MAGPMTHVDYQSDDGNTYRTRIPTWVATLTGEAAATSAVPMPRGLRPRKRYYRVTATGAERSFIVCHTADAQWTDAFGTAATVETGVFGSAGVASTLQGATGERRKAI
jgi:hypothetical protein